MITSQRVRAYGPWALLAVVLVVGLLIGTSARSSPPTLAQRVNAIAGEVRCPSCEDLSAAVSSSQAAVAVRALIRTDLEHGQSKAQIESYLVGRYGPDIILRPSGSGVTGLVWILPVVLALAGLAGAVVVLRRWRGPPVDVEVDDEDRELVQKALEARP